MTEQKGLILINTGTGKGKTTAALGTQSVLGVMDKKFLFYNLLKVHGNMVNLKQLRHWKHVMEI